MSKAGVEEIKSLFKGFKVVRGSIKFGYGADGRRNGEATILFQNQQEATRAQSERNGEYIGARYVDLHLITYDQYNSFDKKSEERSPKKSDGTLSQKQTSIMIGQLLEEQSKQEILSEKEQETSQAQAIPAIDVSRITGDVEEPKKDFSSLHCFFEEEDACDSKNAGEDQ